MSSLPLAWAEPPSPTSFEQSICKTQDRQTGIRWPLRARIRGSQALRTPSQLAPLALQLTPRAMV